jgi:hypothetical protein
MTRANKLLAIVAVVAAAAIAAFYFLALAPLRKEAAKLDTDIAAQQSQLQQARSQLQSYEDARANYAARYTTVARLGKAVPADDDVRSLVIQLSDAARRSGVHFDRIDASTGGSSTGSTSTTGSSGAALPPGATVGTAGFGQQLLEFSFGGRFLNLASFFGRIERLVDVAGKRLTIDGRLLVVNKVTLQKSDPAQTTLDASVSATTYLLPAGEGLTAGATAGAPAGASGATALPTPAPASGGTTTTATATGVVR